MKMFKIKLNKKEVELITTEMKQDNWEEVKHYKIHPIEYFILEVDENSGTSLASELNSIAVMNHSDKDYNISRRGEEIDTLAGKILIAIIGEKDGK